MVAYGGGHMRMLVPVARELVSRGAQVTLLPLTAAIAEARASGLSIRTLTELIGDWPDRDRILGLGRSIALVSGHPAISDEETQAYHGLGLSDLIERLGEGPARTHFAAHGRKAFHPTRSWARLLANIRPDLIVSTNAPRSESAALAAARRSGIPSLCVTDHFLVYEVDYVAKAGHGDLITVLGGAVEDFLVAHGRPRKEVRVTGNAAFDQVFDAAHAHEATEFRQTRGLEDARLVLWPQQSKAAQVGGKTLIRPEQIAPHLLQVLDLDPRTRLIVRPHPNAPDGGFSTRHPSVLFEPEPPIEVLIHAADIVVQQSTTVGIQAALCGKPVVTIGNSGIPPFAEYGLATDIPGPEGLMQALSLASPPDPSRLRAPTDGHSAGRVADVAAELLGGHG